MPRVPFHYIDLRTFCYETEDEKRVEEALRTFLPDEFDVDRVESTGHHGDRIIVFSARVERANDVRHVLDKIRDLPDFETLLDELDQRVTDNTEFFLRLDKQAAFKGEARRGGGSPSARKSRPTRRRRKPRWRTPATPSSATSRVVREPVESLPISLCYSSFHLMEQPCEGYSSTGMSSPASSASTAVRIS